MKETAGIILQGVKKLAGYMRQKRETMSMKLYGTILALINDK